MQKERNRTNIIEKLEMVIGAARRKYAPMQEGTSLYELSRHTFEKSALDYGARRRLSGRVLANAQKLDDFIDMMFSE